MTDDDEWEDPGQDIQDMLIAALLPPKDAEVMWKGMGLGYEQALVVASVMKYVCDEFVLENARKLRKKREEKGGEVT